MIDPKHVADVVRRACLQTVSSAAAQEILATIRCVQTVDGEQELFWAGDYDAQCIVTRELGPLEALGRRGWHTLEPHSVIYSAGLGYNVHTLKNQKHYALPPMFLRGNFDSYFYLNPSKDIVSVPRETLRRILLRNGVV